MARPARILIVEDEHLIALDLRTQLTRMGHTVVDVVASGPSAMAQAEALRPDLVLMDIRLEGPMDGIEAAARIRTHLDLPVVYLTASVDASTLARADATRPAGVLRKPIRHQDLQHTLARVLREIPPAAP